MNMTTSRANVYTQVYELVSQIPAGRLVTYGDIAKALSINPRYVGYILHQNPSPGIVPCHRVVNASGRVADTFAFGGGEAQMRLLEQEGVIFVDGRTDLSAYRHVF